MDYNTKRERLVLPEYGRIVQQMVNHALTIEDREERQECAEQIIKVMGGMFPHLRDVPDFKHKLWDHLAIMAEYKLDVDFPYGKVEPKNTCVKATKLPYPIHRIRYRHYGYLLEECMKSFDKITDDEERQRYTELVANQMKKSLDEWNKDAMNGEKIASDMARYTDGKVQLDLNSFQFSQDSNMSNSQYQARQLRGRKFRRS